MKSPKNAVLVVLALTTIGGAALVWKQHLELVELRASALSNNDRAELNKRLWDAQKKIKELEDELAALRGQRSENADGDTMAADESANRDNNQNRRGRRGQNGPGGRGPNGLATLLEQPAMQKLVAMQQKAQLDGRYAALFKNLNLSPEQLEKFKTLLVERQTAIQDVLAAARTEGINPGEDREALRKMIASTQAEVDNNIKSMLGDEAYAKYQNYQETGSQRNTVNQLQQSLSYTNTPLTDAQAEQLVQILAANNARRGQQQQPVVEGNVTFEVAATPDNGGGRGGNNFGRGGGGGMFVNVGFGGFGGGGGTAQITNEAISASQGVLSSQQVQALQQLQAQQQAQQQLQQSIRDAQRANNNNNGGNRNGGTGGAATTTTQRGG